jgi:hypothetical protein
MKFAAVYCGGLFNETSPHEKRKHFLTGKTEKLLPE